MLEIWHYWDKLTTRKPKLAKPIEQKLFNILQTGRHAPKYCKAIDRISILPIQYEIFVIDLQFHWETLLNVAYAEAMFYSFWTSSSEDYMRKIFKKNVNQNSTYLCYVLCIWKQFPWAKNLLQIYRYSFIYTDLCVSCSLIVSVERSQTHFVTI